MKHTKDINQIEFNKTYKNENIIRASKSSIKEFIVLNGYDFRIKNLNRDNILETLDIDIDGDIFLMTDEVSDVEYTNLFKLINVLLPLEVIHRDYIEIDGQEFAKLTYSIYKPIML